MIQEYFTEYSVPSRGKTAEKVIGMPGGSILANENDTFFEVLYQTYDFSSWYPEYVRQLEARHNPFNNPFNRPSPLGSAEPHYSQFGNEAAQRFAQNMKSTFERLRHTAITGAGDQDGLWVPLAEEY